MNICNDNKQLQYSASKKEYSAPLNTWLSYLRMPLENAVNFPSQSNIKSSQQ